MYFGMDLLSWITLAVLLIFAFDGMRRGMIRTVFSMLTIVIAIVISSAISPYVSQALENTAIYDVISDQVENNLFQDQYVGEFVDYDNTDSQAAVIEKLPLPDAVKESLMANNNLQGYETLGVAGFKNYILKVLTGIVIKALAFVIILVLTGIILNVMAGILNLISYLPVLHTLNHLGGFVIGLINGVVILWILGIVVMIFGSTEWGRYVYSQINGSVLLRMINDNNLFLQALTYIKSTL